MPRHNPEPQQGIQSMEVGSRILQVLAEAPRAMMLRDIAEAAALPAPQAHRYLVSCARMGLVEQHSETGHYDLGPFALQLGLSALARIEPVRVAEPELQALQRHTQHTVALAVWANHGATIVRWLGSDAPVAATLRVGSVMPLTRSATGGAFLAFMARSATADLLRKELADNARRGLEPSSSEALEAVIRRAQRDGVAHRRDFIPGIAGVAAPVFDHSGTMTLALVALGYAEPFEAQLGATCAAVLAAARRLSTRLGYSAESKPTDTARRSAR